MKIELKELRKQVKPLGVKVETKSFSFGRSISYSLDSQKLPMIFNKDELELWKPFLQLLDDLKDQGFTGVQDNGDTLSGHMFRR